MKITVRIADIEVVVDRPGFKDASTTLQDKPLFENIVKPTVILATDKAKELYELKHNKNQQA